MSEKKSQGQIRKGDPLAKMSNSKSYYSDSSYRAPNQFIGYKLNTRIRALRTSKGWSQSELGQKLSDTLNLPAKIPTSTIASWEHKNPSLAKIPSPDKIDGLAK